MSAAPANPPNRRRPVLWGSILLVLGALPWTGLMIWAFLDDAKQGYSRTAEMILQIGLVWLLGVVLMAVAIYPFVYLLSWLIGKFARRAS